MRRDLLSEVSARIIAELERGPAPWVKPWSATARQNVPQNAVTNRPYPGCNVILLWLARNRGWPTPRFLPFKQASEAGGNVRKGEHGTKVYFVKQLQIKDGDGEESATRLIPMMREYTVFNVDQCENLPDSFKAGKPMRVRNPDTRDALGDEFPASTGADIHEGHGEAYYVPSHDFISIPAFEAPFSSGSLLKLLGLGGKTCALWIKKGSHCYSVRYNIAQQAEPFRVNLIGDNTNPCGVSPGSAETCNKP
jgi:antirestriction protein ArdC